jgi:hypothetical protein
LWVKFDTGEHTVGGNYWFEMHEGGTLNQAKRLVS